jgi:hypothetical protein
VAKFDFAKYAAARARAGDPYPLIGRLLYVLQRADAPLSDDEIAFIREALEATANKRTDAAGLRLLELQLIARQVDGLIDVDGCEPKNAVDAVMLDRGRSLRHIRTALSKYGKPRRRRR